MIIQNTNNLTVDNLTVAPQRNSKKYKFSKKDNLFFSSTCPSNKAATVAMQKLKDSKLSFENSFITEENDYEIVVIRKTIFSAM